MRINLTSFLIGIIFCLMFFLFSGGIFMPKHLKVNSIEVIDEGKNNSGFIEIGLLILYYKELINLG